MIQIENLSKVFRTSEVETIALNHVNIEVKEGEFSYYGTIRLWKIHVVEHSWIIG